MAIYYDFYKTRGALSEKSDYHVRVVDGETIETGVVTRSIERGTSLTTADLKGALSALSNEISDRLCSGRRVHIAGIGYFSLSIKGDVCRDKQGKLRLKNPAIRTVLFRPDREMMRKLNETQLSVCRRGGNHSGRVSNERIAEAIDLLLGEKDFFTTADFCVAAKLAHATAYRILMRLMAEGTLVNAGTPYCKLYKKGTAAPGDV